MRVFQNIKKIPISKNILTLISINLVITLIGLEVLSLAFFWFQEKSFYYNNTKPTQKVFLELEKSGFNLNDSIGGSLHPFLGYVIRQGMNPFKEFGINVNNYGMYSKFDYPFIKSNQNQFIIGIFGGSVASGVYLHELKTQSLATALKKLPEYSNKEIIVLSFAIQGTKQPQQLLSLNYFLSIGQKFDMVINIDGFNEVALTFMNNREKVELSMPLADLTLPLINMANHTLSTEEMKAMIQINQIKNDLKASIARSSNCWFSLCYLVTSTQTKFLINSYQKQALGFISARAISSSKSENTDQPSLIYYNRLKEKLPDFLVIEKSVAFWKDSSLFMHQITTNNGIKYFHFLQPNQYYPTNHVFSENEKKIAFYADSPYTEGVIKGYPVLISKISDLRSLHINAFNMVNIFDTVKDDVYMDSCCHYNEQGQQIVIDFIANSILSTHH